MHLGPGESREVTISLDRRAFAVYDVASATWAVEAGDFEVRVGASSRDIRLPPPILSPPTTWSPRSGAAGPVATDEELAALLGHPVPDPRPLLPLHEDSTIDDLGEVWLGRRLRGLLLRMVAQGFDAGSDPQVVRMIHAVVRQMPLRGIAMNSGGRLSFRVLDAVLWLLNLGHRQAGRR